MGCDCGVMGFLAGWSQGPALMPRLIGTLGWWSTEVIADHQDPLCLSGVGMTSGSVFDVQEMARGIQEMGGSVTYGQ